VAQPFLSVLLGVLFTFCSRRLPRRPVSPVQQRQGSQDQTILRTWGAPCCAPTQSWTAVANVDGAAVQKKKPGGRPSGSLHEIVIGLVNRSRRLADSGLLWLGFGNNRSNRFLFESQFEHFIQRAHVADLQVAQNFGRQIGYRIRFVVRRQ